MINWIAHIVPVLAAAHLSSGIVAGITDDNHLLLQDGRIVQQWYLPGQNEPCAQGKTWTFIDFQHLKGYIGEHARDIPAPPVSLPMGQRQAFPSWCLAIKRPTNE